ncbi:alpha/beta fold hydrolase [Neptuniibacter halophilus]|uniref:alpha/beta fold hydrolase n=1 Tax=Neptuniibacter halophilus TaxID=651666 RepID=UPI002572D250|nr:alpha/beta hydrolase [Neptuniibacter halophilus]
MEIDWLSAELKQRYQAQWQRLQGFEGARVDGRYLQTSMGPVWVLEAGPEDAPPLFAVHGLHTPAPFTLELFWPLTQHYRVICADIPGQAGRTPGVAPLPNTPGYGLWLDQLLSALDIPRCPMVGLSFGSAVLLDLAAQQPERISAASLVVPAGFFRPLLRPMKRLVLPLLSFKLHTDQLHFDQLMKPLMGDNWPELEAYYFAVFQAGMPMTLIPPGPFAIEHLSRFKAPVQLIYALDDLYFDPEKLQRKAQQALPDLEQQIAIDDLHIPNAQNRRQIQDQVLQFMRNKNRLW